MKKLFVIAIAAFMGLTMNAQPNTKQQVGVAQSKMMRPVETKLDLSAVKQMPKQPGKLVRMSKDYGKKLSLRNIDLKPVAHSKTNVNPMLLKKASLPASFNAMSRPISVRNGVMLNKPVQRKSVNVNDLKAFNRISASAPLKVGAVKEKYNATGINYGYDRVTETETQDSVEWVMTSTTATLENETVVNVLFDVVPELEDFKSIEGYEDGIPLIYTISDNTVSIEPQIIASGTDEEEGEFYVYIFANSSTGVINLTLGEDGSLKSSSNQEILVGALNTTEFALTNDTFMWYYQWTGNIKYTYEGQSVVESPFNETYPGSGYDYFDKKDLSWTMTPDAEEGTFKFYIPAPADLAKYFPTGGVDVPYTINGDVVTVDPYYLGLGYTDKETGDKFYLTLFGVTDGRQIGAMSFKLGEDKTLTPQGSVDVIIGEFKNTQFDATLDTVVYKGAYIYVEGVRFGEGGSVEPDFDFESTQDYQGFGTDYQTQSSVNWTMQRGTLIENEKSYDALLNIVPEPEAFEAIYPTGIPVVYKTQASTIVVEPQPIAHTSDGYNVMLFSGVSDDYSITMTVGDDGSLTTIDGEEIVIGAFKSENIDFDGDNYGGYYQITDNVKFLLPNQKMAPNPNYEPEGLYLFASMSVSGYSYYAPLAMIPAYAPVSFKNYTADPADEWSWKIAPYKTDSDEDELVLDEDKAVTATTQDFEFNSVGGEVYAPAQLKASLNGEQSDAFVWGKDYVSEEDGSVYNACVYAGRVWSPFSDDSEPVITRANINDFDLYYDGNHATPDKANYAMSKLYLYQGKPSAPLYCEGVNMLVYNFESQDNFTLKCKLIKVERNASGRIALGDVIAEAEMTNDDVETVDSRSLLQWKEFYVEDEFGMSQTLDHLFIDEEFMIVIEGWDNGTFSCYPMIDGYDPTNGSQSIYFELAEEEGSVYSFTGYCSHLMVGFIHGTYGYLHTEDDTDITIPATGGEATIHVKPMLSSIDEETEANTTRLFIGDIMDEVPEWIMLEVKNEKYTEDEYSFDLVVSAEALPAGEESREGEFVVWQEGARMVITVKQIADETSGVATTVVTKAADNKSYNLAGQQTKKGKGLVVSKGKKFIVK